MTFLTLHFFTFSFSSLRTLWTLPSQEPDPRPTGNLIFDNKKHGENKNSQSMT